MAGRRAFGRVRKLPSGRYQARYTGPDGQLRPAPHTFRTKREADDWLADLQSQLRRGDWNDPDSGKLPFGEYASVWITERGLSTRTAELYRSLLRIHLAPTLGAVAIADISPAAVRRWRAERLEAGTGPSTTAKAYALLRAVLGTAVTGAGLLGVGLSAEPDSKKFYGVTLAVAGVWTTGALCSGPLHLGYARTSAGTGFSTLSSAP